MLIAGAPAALVDHARTERQERRAATEDDRITEHAQLVHEAELERRRGPAGASVRLVATLSSGHSSRIGSNAIHDNARTVVQPRTEHRFSWWHQGVFLFDRAYAWSDDCSEYIEAASGPWLGQSHSREVTFVSPGGAVFSSEDAPLVVEVLDEPPELSNEADS